MSQSPADDPASPFNQPTPHVVGAEVRAEAGSVYQVSRDFISDAEPASLVATGFPGTVDIIPPDVMAEIVRLQALLAQALTAVQTLPLEVEQRVAAIFKDRDSGQTSNVAEGRVPDHPLPPVIHHFTVVNLAIGDELALSARRKSSIAGLYVGLKTAVAETAEWANLLQRLTGDIVQTAANLTTLVDIGIQILDVFRNWLGF